VLAQSHEPADIFINPLAWYEENDIKLHAGVRAARIDLGARVVHGMDGVAEPYDKLVLATGSRALAPPMEGMKGKDGAPKEGLFVFRTLEDCNQIAAYAARCKKAVVIGGGLLGLEAARGLLGHGLEVHVVHLMGHLMEMQLDARGGALLQAKLEKMGLHVHLRKNTKEILGEERVSGVRFEDGGKLGCELVVVSAGIRPNVELAREAGLLVERGIVVGDDLATSDPHVHALGECAQHRGRTYGLVAPCWEQAQVLAERLSGKKPRAIYAGSRISTKLKVMGIDLTVMGAREAVTEEDQEVEYVDKKRGVYKKLVVREGKLAGAILLGEAESATRFLHAFDRGTALPDDPAQFLFPAAEAAGAQGILEAPDEAQVCNCNGVSKAAILSSVRGGKRTLKALCDATRAGTGCGSSRAA
jgi:nitrite reductase (NADH) large subunit